MPRYTGLKDFAQGVQKLYKMHGNIPVFLEVAGHFAPFGIAVQCSELLGGEAMVFKGGRTRDPQEFEKGDCTE